MLLVAAERLLQMRVCAYESKSAQHAGGNVSCRWKSSQEYHWQSGPAAGEPWYTDPYGALWVTSCIPAEEQKFMEQRMLQVNHLASLFIHL